jgi:nicotinamide-nucleotide amidase
LGISVERIIVVSDTVSQISRALCGVLQRHPDVLVITGGLGPTYDDVTADGLASALRLPKECNRAALEMVESKYRSLGLEMTPARQKMAMMPLGSMPIANDVGTAPGISIAASRTTIFCLPGVPAEMVHMFDSWVLKDLNEKAGEASFQEETIVVKGMPESSLAPLIDEWRSRGRGVYLKSHPSKGEAEPEILVHLSLAGGDRIRMARDIKSARNAFEAIVRRHGGKIGKG